MGQNYGVVHPQVYGYPEVSPCQVCDQVLGSDGDTVIAGIHFRLAHLVRGVAMPVGDDICNGKCPIQLSQVRV